MGWPPKPSFTPQNGSSRLPFQIPLEAYSVSGSYVDGQWQEVETVMDGVTANVQPATIRDYSFLEADTEIASRQGRLIRLYTESVLKVLDQESSPPTKGDIVVYDGERYRVVRKSPWQSGIMSHYRYLALRVPEGS